MKVMSESISNLKSLTQLNLYLGYCSSGLVSSTTDESVVSIGRMLGGLTSLTQLTLDMSKWKHLSDRSMKLMGESISNLRSLTHLNLDLSFWSHQQKSMTDESVISVGRMLGGLTSLT
jgi:hypothetical protein